jgi:hypothetical protein
MAVDILRRTATVISPAEDERSRQLHVDDVPDPQDVRLAIAARQQVPPVDAPADVSCRQHIMAPVSDQGRSTYIPR